MGDWLDFFYSLQHPVCRAQDDYMFMLHARQALARASPGICVARLDDDRVLQSLAQIPPQPQPATQAELSFDGKLLCWKTTSLTEIKKTCWSAVSGREGYQSKEYQTVVGQGPIPEGKWLVAQSQYQRMPERSLLDQVINGFGKGTWPGGERSWGQHRVWLTPADGTNTYGRQGFSIHGGSSPGSAGCIDLTKKWATS